MLRSFPLALKLKLIVLVGAVTFGMTGFFGVTRDIAGVSASAFGPAASHTGAPNEANCTECHNSFPLNSGTGSVYVSGLPEKYTPGQQITITVTTRQSAAIVYGFQLVALDASGHDAGSVTLPTGSPQRTQAVTGIVNGVVRTYIEHTIDGIVPTQFGFNSWTFTWTAPATDIGPVTFYAAGNAADSNGNTDGDYIYTTARTLFPKSRAPIDFDGDGKTDIGITRPNNGVTEWWLSRSSDSNVFATVFGLSSDIPAPADFTGDGKTDIAIFRPSNGNWFILRSEDFTFLAFPFGANGDIPMPADFDGDGKADTAVYRPSTFTWFIPLSGGRGTTIAQFGAAGDLPVAADYDGDGKADIAIYRQNGGIKEWWVQRSNLGLFATVFGVTGDKAVPGDFTGDGKTDIAIWRPSNGNWFILRSEDFSFLAFPWGAAGDIPAPGDYDGDGKTDAAVFRQSSATWFVNRTGGSGPLITNFGAATDNPVAGVFVR
jgi:hypothetical protein